MEEEEQKPWYDGLTDKQRRFVEEYCIDYNGAAAARRAGYSERTAHEQASQNLAKLSVRAAVDAYLNARSMVAAEALDRLTTWARGTIEPFIQVVEVPVFKKHAKEEDEDDEDEGDDEDRTTIPDIGTTLVAKIDLTTDQAQESLHLIKKIKQTKYGLEIEIHDPMAAVNKILEVRGKIIQRTDVTSGGKPLPADTVRTWIIQDHSGNGKVREPDED